MSVSRSFINACMFLENKIILKTQRLNIIINKGHQANTVKNCGEYDITQLINGIFAIRPSDPLALG